MYSKQAKEVLEKYGWYEDRKIDISEQLEMLEKAGFEMFDKVKEFIVEFDGLRLPAEYRNKNFDEKILIIGTILMCCIISEVYFQCLLRIGQGTEKQ